MHTEGSQMKINTRKGKHLATTKLWCELGYAELADDNVRLCNLRITKRIAHTTATSLLHHFTRTHIELMAVKKNSKFNRPEFHTQLIQIHDMSKHIITPHQAKCITKHSHYTTRKN